MPRSAKLRLALSIVLGVVSVALFIRGFAYYVGTGPHDGEDFPSFVTLMAGAAALFAAVLISWRPRGGSRTPWVVGVWVSGVLLLMTFGLWALNALVQVWMT